VVDRTQDLETLWRDTGRTEQRQPDLARRRDEAEQRPGIRIGNHVG